MFPHGDNYNNQHPDEINPISVCSNNYNPHNYSPDHPMKTRGYIKEHNRSPDINLPAPVAIGIIVAIVLCWLI